MSEDRFQNALSGVGEFLVRVQRLEERQRAGEIRARIPPGLDDLDRPLEALRAGGSVLGVEGSGAGLAEWLAAAVAAWRRRWPLP